MKIQEILNNNRVFRMKAVELIHKIEKNKSRDNEEHDER